MVDRTPKVMLLPVYLQEHFFEVPASVTDSAHAQNALAPNFLGEDWPESVPPEPHLVRTASPRRSAG